ncbi:deoxyribonuclease II [Cooperia oncophora]
MKFVVYKPPTQSRSAPLFYYADGDRSNWNLGSLPITATITAVGATLQPFYERDQRHFIFAYNDDSPSGKVESYRGHSKGVVVFDDETGFWMIHSVPNFPSLSSYSYPATGIKFGQTFLCLSLPTRFLGDVGDHLRYLQATPFFYNLPNQFSERFPVLVNIVKKQSLSKSATHFTRIGQLSTIRGMTLKSFAKHKKFNKDLWFDLVGPELGTNMAVESWLNGGADDLESICTRRISVYDVSEVTLPNISFNSSRDHSKWAVADTEGRTSTVCVGDLNRQV